MSVGSAKYLIENNGLRSFRDGVPRKKGRRQLTTTIQLVNGKTASLKCTTSQLLSLTCTLNEDQLEGFTLHPNQQLALVKLQSPSYLWQHHPEPKANVLPGVLLKPLRGRTLMGLARFTGTNKVRTYTPAPRLQMSTPVRNATTTFGCLLASFAGCWPEPFMVRDLHAAYPATS